MSERILFILEGVKPETKILDSIFRHFFSGESIEIVIFHTHIYQLYRRIKDEDLAEFIDIVEYLREDPAHKETLKDYKFSQVFLFFDFDGHVPEASNSHMEELLEHFNEETENGKLFISYPMSESLKHIPRDEDEFKDLTVDVVNVGPNTSTYKTVAAHEGFHGYGDFANLDKSRWAELIVLHCKKSNYLVHNDCQVPTTRVPSQDEIFSKQLDLYNANSQVSVISAFPLFLAEYFGCNYIHKLICENSEPCPPS